MVSVPARRQQVAYGRGRGLSARRACTPFSVARSALEYRSRKAAKDAPVVTRMKELSAQYPRYGYRRIRIFLNRDGHRMSPGRAHRLWQTARLQVPRKRPRKRITAAPRPRPQAPSGPNQVWCYDFVFDHCANGQQLKCLTVADEFTKEGLAIDVDGRIRSGRVIEVLSRLVSARGAPRFVRSDNGPEFVSKALLSWIVTQGIGTALIEPGKPWQNGVAESFNGKFRDECLSLERPSQANRGPKDLGRSHPAAYIFPPMCDAESKAYQSHQASWVLSFDAFVTHQAIFSFYFYLPLRLDFQTTFS